MEEFQTENQDQNNESLILSNLEVEELNASFAESNEDISNEVLESIVKKLEEDVTEKKEVYFRHPQQILRNKEIQILLEKQQQEDNIKEELKKEGKDTSTVELLTLTERNAIKLFFIRARNNNSKTKFLSTKQRRSLKKKRKVSRTSRKINRKK